MTFFYFTVQRQEFVDCNQTEQVCNVRSCVTATNQSQPLFMFGFGYYNYLVLGLTRLLQYNTIQKMNETK